MMFIELFTIYPKATQLCAVKKPHLISARILSVFGEKKKSMMRRTNINNEQKNLSSDQVLCPK